MLFGGKVLPWGPGRESLGSTVPSPRVDGRDPLMCARELQCLRRFKLPFHSQTHTALVFPSSLVFHDSLVHLQPRGLNLCLCALTSATLLPGMPFPCPVAAALPSSAHPRHQNQPRWLHPPFQCPVAQLLYTVKERFSVPRHQRSHLVNAPTDCIGLFPCPCARGTQLGQCGAPAF